jgi:hypothetical protein
MNLKDANRGRTEFSTGRMKSNAAAIESTALAWVIKLPSSLSSRPTRARDRVESNS